jgi:hypothetical protein
MTAILTWAKLRSWTTKEMEATIFAEYGDKKVIPDGPRDPQLVFCGNL